MISALIHIHRLWNLSSEIHKLAQPITPLSFNEMQGRESRNIWHIPRRERNQGKRFCPRFPCPSWPVGNTMPNCRSTPLWHLLGLINGHLDTGACLFFLSNNNQKIKIKFYIKDHHEVKEASVMATSNCRLKTALDSKSDTSSICSNEGQYYHQTIFFFFSIMRKVWGTQIQYCQ